MLCFPTVDILHVVLSYDKTSYDKTSYDKTSYDKTSYDKTSYDKTSYDKTDKRKDASRDKNDKWDNRSHGQIVLETKRPTG